MPLSALYGAAVALRQVVYRLGLRRVHRPQRPVICIGNLSTGGAGKTSMVEWVCRRLLQEGRSFVILSRGYKRPAGKMISDEGMILRENLGEVRHYFGADRSALIQRAMKDGEPDCFILDDGFQHFGLARDVDILLVDALNPFGYGHLLPRGLLREPPSALRRADAVVLTRSDQCPPEQLQSIRRALARWARGAPLAEAVHSFAGAVDHASGEPLDISDLAKKAAYAFCGIGNPDSFLLTLGSLGIDVRESKAYGDHHYYSAQDVRKISAAARSVGAQVIVTTQKDKVRLPPAAEFTLPLAVILVQLHTRKGEGELLGLIRRALDKTQVGAGRHPSQ